MSSRSNQLKDDILNQIAEQIKGLQLSQQTALDEGITNFQVTANNIHLQCLLDLLDHILLHGLEKVEFGYWPFVKELTHSETVKHIVNHPQVTTDLDKGRVWIFTAFSDGLLESYIRLFADSQKQAKKFYTRKAFARDKERLTVLQTLVSGLDFISIVLDQEWPYLGYGTQHFQDSTNSVVGDGKSQGTFASSKAAEGVNITSSEEKDDNHSIASSSISSSSTVTGPLSPNSHASITAPPSPDSNGTYQQESKLNSKQEELQTSYIKNGSAQIHNSDEHETQVSEETVTDVQKQQAQSRLHFSRNFQTDQVMEDDNIVFEPLKKKNRKHLTRRKKLVDNGKYDERNDSFEVTPEPICNIDDHSRERSNKEGQDESYEELPKETSYGELLHLSRTQRSSFRSQDSYPSCSSPTSSIQSTDSLDQFCKDFESSCNLTSEMSLNSATVQLCDNKAEPDLCNEEINEEHGFPNNDNQQLTTTVKESDQGSLNADKAPSYEGIILGLPKRPLLRQIPVTSCDISVDQNTMLTLSLEVFEKNGEQFHRMLVVMCGHLSSQLYFVYVLLTDHAIYLLKKVPSHEGKSFQVHLAFSFATLKKIEVGLNYQTVTLASKTQKCVLFVADEAVTRDLLSSVTSMIVKSGQGSLLSKIVSTSTFQQETLIKKWMNELENIQCCSMDIRCFSFVRWYGLSGPDASIEVLSYKSVKEGYMDCKQPQYLRRAFKWTTSYFVLMNGTLYQHVKQGDEVGKVVVQLRGSRCGGCRRVNDPDRPHAFEVVAEDGSPLIALAAFSEDDTADWIFRICQAVAETFDSEDEMSCTVMKCVPCCLILTDLKIVACLPNPNKEETFQLLSECSVQSVTRLFLDNDVRNYCILEFERSEIAGRESSWFVWFKTEYELAKFERALLEAWQELFQIDLQFLVLGEGSMRETARQQAKNIGDLYKSQTA
ncbi:pleckstrin homology domain-containing family M member 2-like isoform X1 [Oculina patagonica]